MKDLVSMGFLLSGWRRSMTRYLPSAQSKERGESEVSEMWASRMVQFLPKKEYFDLGKLA